MLLYVVNPYANEGSVFVFSQESLGFYREKMKQRTKKKVSG
jgi:hypothetical protein